MEELLPSSYQPQSPTSALSKAATHPSLFPCKKPTPACLCSHGRTTKDKVSMIPTLTSVPPHDFCPAPHHFLFISGLSHCPSFLSIFLLQALPSHLSCYKEPARLIILKHSAEVTRAMVTSQCRTHQGSIPLRPPDHLSSTHFPSSQFHFYFLQTSSSPQFVLQNVSAAESARFRL